MTKLKCIAVDDEPLALEVIEAHISKCPEMELVGKCGSAIEAVEMIKRESPDMLLLDIQMPEITGVELMKSLDVSDTMVVFTTAYEEYAAEAFNLEALDYLVKPISFDRFEKMYQKALELNEMRKDVTDVAIEPDMGHIFVKSDQKMVKVSYTEIKYIEAFADYVKIYLSDSKRIVTLQTMKKMTAALPSNIFCRIHRSYIVNVPKVESFNGNEVNIGDKSIPIGKNYKQDFMNLMQGKNLLK
jgi:two-component system LytT family response regulator